MHICKKGEFFMAKKSKKWSPTTKMIYKRDLTLEVWSLHLYESRILTAWINSRKISVNDTLLYKMFLNIQFEATLLKKLVYPFFFIKSCIKRIIFRFCSQDYLFWYRSVFKSNLWSSASVQKDYSIILQH